MPTVCLKLRYTAVLNFICFNGKPFYDTYILYRMAYDMTLNIKYSIK